MGRYVAAGTLILALAAGANWAKGREPGQNDKKPGKENSVPPEVEQLQQRWYQAWLDKDAVTVERLMADDYVYVAPNGQTQDRAAILRIIHSPSYRLRHLSRTNVIVRMLGDNAAVIRHRGQDDGEFEGKAFKDDHILVQVCARERGEWRVVVEQCTENKP